MSTTRRAAMLLAHAQPAVLTAAIAADTAHQVTDTPAVALVQGCLLGAILLAYVAGYSHQHRLCPRCAAATPTDGLAAALATPTLAAAGPRGC